MYLPWLELAHRGHGLLEERSRALERSFEQRSPLAPVELSTLFVVDITSPKCRARSIVMIPPPERWGLEVRTDYRHRCLDEGDAISGCLLGASGAGYILTADVTVDIDNATANSRLVYLILSECVL